MRRERRAARHGGRLARRLPPVRQQRFGLQEPAEQACPRSALRPVGATGCPPRLSGMLMAARHRDAGSATPATDGPFDAELLLALEAFADEIVVFDPWLVPPQLQTQEYAAAISELDDLTKNTARELPLTDDTDPLLFRWVTSEHALRRRIGGPAVAADQLTHLVRLGELPNVTIRVIPAGVELPPANPFQLLCGSPPVVVEPSRLAFHHTAEPDAVARFASHLDVLEQRALTPEASLALLADALP
ncbi:DUF5753 domain-containing protein [Actinokineospora sp. 24-640]